MALDTTVAGPNANSYASEAEADTYNSCRLHVETWDNATPEVKEAALKWARLLLDSDRCAWVGSPSTTTQALRWPRTGTTTRDGAVIASGVIPYELKAAQSEYARQLIDADRTADNSVLMKGITEIKAGSVAVKFAEVNDENSDLVVRTQRRLNALAAVMPDAVKMLLSPTWLLEDEEDAKNSQFIFESLQE
jgi:hypothetical protein